MKINLGYWLDSGSYPDELKGKSATMGTVTVGYKGLIGVLETQLGLTAPQVSENIRISQWQQLIDKMNTGNEPFSKSFAIDSWNTAKELLRRRDELIISGWDPHIHNGGGKWIEAIATLELNNQNKQLGFSDCVRNVIRKLEEQTSHLAISEITIVDEDLSLWDPWLIRIIDLLKENGVKVTQHLFENPEIQDDSSNLEKLQRVFASEKRSEIDKQDESLLLVQADQEIDAADFLASYLQEKGSADTVIIKGEGSLVLDEMLNRRGVSRLGFEKSTKWRAVLQVLPLAIDTYWKPVRVERMLEFLSLPESPVPSFVRHRLAYALSKEPGIGGEVWNEALEKGIQSYEAMWQKENVNEVEIKRERKKLTKRIDTWINHKFYDPETGIPFEKLVEISQTIGDWAMGRYVSTNDDTFLETKKIADEFIATIQSLGTEYINQIQVERILDSIIGSGVQLDTYFKQAAPWETVHEPGQVWQHAETIIWWGFNQSIATQNMRTWTSKERDWLKQQGIQLMDERLRRKRETNSWRRAVQFAKKRLIFISIGKIAGEAIPVHPLWDEVRFALGDDHETINKLTFKASELRKKETSFIFNSKRNKQFIQRLPEVTVKWNVPEQMIQPREVESATSIENLIGCPLKYTFNYVAKIKQGNILGIPNEPVMLGNLSHIILEKLINEKTNWSEDEIASRVGSLFDQLVPKLAAPLLEPQNTLVLYDTRRSLQNSITHFFRVLNEAGIVIEGTEVEYEKEWQQNVRLHGRLDLLVETRAGNKMFIDAKFSRRPKKYKKQLEKTSIQLALYHWLLVDHEDEQLPVAYFMLSTGDFFSLAHEDFPSDYHVDGPSLSETFKEVTETAKYNWNQLDSGNVVAAGVWEKQKDVELDEFKPLIDSPCHFCDYKNLCGVGRSVQ